MPKKQKDPISKTIQAESNRRVGNPDWKFNDKQKEEAKARQGRYIKRKTTLDKNKPILGADLAHGGAGRPTTKYEQDARINRALAKETRSKKHTGKSFMGMAGRSQNIRLEEKAKEYDAKAKSKEISDAYFKKHNPDYYNPNI